LSELICPRCKSTDISVREDHCTCNICGEKFQASLTSEDIQKRFFSSTALRAEVRRQQKDFIEKKDLEAKEARIKASKFNWRSHGDEIPGVAALVLLILAVLSSVSMSSFLSLPFAGAAIVCGIIYAVLKTRKKNPKE
jgi:hypothetical protein